MSVDDARIVGCWNDASSLTIKLLVQTAGTAIHISMSGVNQRSLERLVIRSCFMLVACHIEIPSRLLSRDERTMVVQRSFE
jgi:hypothetical protein